MQRTTCWDLTCFTLGATLLVVSGCATMKLPDFTATKNVRADADNPVAQIVCIWQPAEGRGLDEMPSRGFAGQIVFLTANSPTPVEVEGNVTIYLFDDQATSIEEQKRPLHVARFVDGSWQTHLKTTAWGPTYQLFLPYVRKGHHRANCSLAVQIDTPDGRRVTSEMANISLQGSGPLGQATNLPFAPQSKRFPAGRVHRAGNAGAGDATHVVQASAQSPLAGTPQPQAPPKPQAPSFQSFSIPYDYHQAIAR